MIMTITRDFEMVKKKKKKIEWDSKGLKDSIALGYSQLKIKVVLEKLFWKIIFLWK